MSCRKNITNYNCCKGWRFYDHFKTPILEYGESFFLILRDFDKERVNQWPVIVYYVNGNAIGMAKDKRQYILIWNQDPQNNKLGELAGKSNSPFGFKLTVLCGLSSPSWLLGYTVLQEMGIITEDGQAILSEEGLQLIEE